MADETSAALGPLDVRRVMAALPHRYPMLLVDRVEKLIRDDRITATKAVTINEGFFAGHFPDRPIMPGVLIVEALAQASPAFCFGSRSSSSKSAQPSASSRARPMSASSSPLRPTSRR
jgi:3-hydroxymyristoyl/3-hydroxydecanoyl-(acyl carrier protein) dehydratase